MVTAGERGRGGYPQVCSLSRVKDPDGHNCLMPDTPERGARLFTPAEVAEMLQLSVDEVIALVLGYRAVRHYLDLRARANRATTPPPPKRPKFWKGELVVTKVFDETPDVRTFRLAAPDGGPLPFDYEAGQYLNLALEIAGAPVRRSYTIASSPTRRGYCELTIKRKADGYASGHLHDTLSVGSRLKVSAPAGRFVFDRMSAKSVVLLAGGVGITPVMSMLRALTDGCWAGEIYLVFAARTRKDVIFEDELEYLRKRFSNLHVTVTLSNEPDAAWTGARGRLTEAFLAGALPAARDVPVYLCGPERMMDDTRAMLVAMGFAPDAVYTEAFVSPASAPALTAGASAPAETSDASDRLVTIRFAKSGRSAECRGAQTVLEAAEEAGVSVPFECRSGICGQCKLRLLDGAVTMDAEDALTDADRKGGRILACQAHPTRDVSVEA
jgi:ferredoxin-NADP reductase